MAGWAYDKETGKTIIVPTGHEILNSLEDMPQWSKILLNHTNEIYKDVLTQIIEHDFYRHDDKITLGAIAKQAAIDQGKLKKWLVRIYDDIFDLNYEQPDLFQSTGIRHQLLLSNMRNHCALNIWLPSTPRQGDIVELYFVRAKLDNYLYTVTRVTYEIAGNETIISLRLEGGFINPYRDWLLHRAEFEQRIGYRDKRDTSELEMDEQLRKWYK